MAWSDMVSADGTDVAVVASAIAPDAPDQKDQKADDDQDASDKKPKQPQNKTPKHPDFHGHYEPTDSVPEPPSDVVTPTLRRLGDGAAAPKDGPEGPEGPGHGSDDGPEEGKGHEKSFRMSFSFLAHANVYVWDPTISAAFDSGLENGAGVLTSGLCALALSAVAVLAMF